MSSNPRGLWGLLVSVLLLSIMFGGAGCFFDKSGFGAPSDAGQNQTDSTAQDAYVPDSEVLPDAQPDVYVPPCTGDTWECLADGTARVCQDDDWVPVGACPLGCDVDARRCDVPSNVPGDLFGHSTAGLNVTGADAPVSIDTDTGAITGANGPIRAPGEGLDATSGIYFETRAQAGNPGLGVFVMQGLTIDAGARLNATGDNALVLLVNGAANLHGRLHVSANGNQGGVGGYDGGGASQPGSGPCGGTPGQGEQASHGCNSGSGGGGHAGAGGSGGNSTCGSDFPGGAGGTGTCGVPELVPLVGGSGGAGGVPIPNVAANPGVGGGGGGAVQLSASDTITVSSGGGINAGGGGGRQCTSAGGAGAGSGGAILLEGPSVTVLGGGALAANGGGGGGGDCT